MDLAEQHSLYSQSAGMGNPEKTPSGRLAVDNIPAVPGSVFGTLPLSSFDPSIFPETTPDESVPSPESVICPYPAQEDAFMQDVRIPTQPVSPMENNTPENQISSANPPTMEAFWKAVFEEREYVSPSPFWIFRFIDRHILRRSQPPLFPLHDTETEHLYHDLMPICQERLEHPYLNTLTTDFALLSPEEMNQAGLRHLGGTTIVGGSLFPALPEAIKKAVTWEEKRRLFADPDFWDNTAICETVSGYQTAKSVNMQPSRPFWNIEGQKPHPLGDYGIPYEDVERYLLLVSGTASPGEPVTVMDIGGDNGRALRQLVTRFASARFGRKVEGINITLHEQPAMHPGIRHILATAERLPGELKNCAHLIFSNNAWYYFRYPELAFYNMLLALRTGGIADVDFSLSWHDCSMDWINNRYLPFLARLSDLVGSNKIELKTPRISPTGVFSWRNLTPARITSANETNPLKTRGRIFVRKLEDIRIEDLV